MVSKEYHIPLALRLRRPIAKTLIRWIFQIIAHIHATGLENIPRGTAYVVAINHVSIFDPPLALSFWPETVEAIGAGFSVLGRNQAPSSLTTQHLRWPVRKMDHGIFVKNLLTLYEDSVL